ncbi:MAG TPA: hemerythrin domain-containing protein [Terriglobia bacterium]|nr:hemerythrin domain-containing protein [Terriglobia bacterium]
MPDLTVNHLRREHQEAQSALQRLGALLNELEQDPAWTPERCKVFETIRDFLTHGLLQLFQKEEEVLFPALQGLFPQPEGPLQVLRGEHETLKSRFGEVCRAGRSLRKGENPEQNLRAFCQAGRSGAEALGDHFYKEDRVLFPMVARYLTPERDAELALRMEGITHNNTASIEGS